MNAVARLPLWLFGLLVALLLAGAAAGRTPDADLDGNLEAARQQIDGIQKRLADDDPANDDLDGARATLFDVQQQADQIVAAQSPLLTSAQARLTELGAPPEAGKEAPDVAEQRQALQRHVGELDARIKLARLLALESDQLGEQIGERRRARFQAELFERTPSVLAGPFWRELQASLPRDLGRLRAASSDAVSAASDTPGLVWFGLAALIAAAVGLRLWLGRRLGEVAAHRAPPGRVRRSLYAFARTALAVVVPGAIAYALMLGVMWGELGREPLRDLLGGVVGVVCFSSFVAGLGHALLAPNRPSWRLPALPDSMARGLRWYPLLVAVVIFVGWATQRLATLVQAGLATVVAINVLYALVLGISMASIVRRSERLRRLALAEAGGAPSRHDRPFWLSLLVVGVWLALVASLVAIVVGYVALGSFVVRQVTWISILLMAAYLLNLLIDDAFTAWLRSAPAEAGDSGKSAAPTGSLRDQVAVLLSGALRLTIVLLVLVLILAPYGEGPADLLQRTDQLRIGVSVGEVQIRPAAVLQALLVFALAMWVVRVLRRWLTDSFLPTTTLDAGMRTTATTLLGFVGAIVAVALALSAIGLGLDRVAWVASALSVGIGFGLQAVVSNFVSGLILLAERPVKVGDWVALGGVEGDIRRINVRATEIQMGDRSTLIVPNSEFITKTVRNVTHGTPLGLVQIKLPMPLDTDTERVRGILEQAYREHGDVLETPAPSVFLDGIDAAGNLVFNATGFVGSPRQAYGVKSALLFTVLKALREADLPMWRPPTMVLRDPPPGGPAAGDHTA